jgi:hypothetical protein
MQVVKRRELAGFIARCGRRAVFVGEVATQPAAFGEAG